MCDILCSWAGGSNSKDINSPQFIYSFNAVPVKIQQFCQTSVQFSSVAQSCPTLRDLMNRSTSGLPVHHQLPEFTETHAH